MIGNASGTGHGNLVFRMKPDSSGRMAGSVPVWEREDAEKDSAQDKVAGNLGAAVTTQPGNFSSALAYAAQDSKPQGAPKPFGFGDLLDIVNPLQHIPIISTIYQNATGDRPGPASEVLGGALYGGVIGAAAGLADVIVAHETGKDIGNHVMAMVSPSASSADRNSAAVTNAVRDVARIEPAAGTEDDPQRRMAGVSPQNTSQTAAQRLPGTVIGIANLGADDDSDMPLTPPAQRQPVTQIVFNDYSHLNN